MFENGYSPKRVHGWVSLQDLELQVSMKRLERAGIHLAVFLDGRVQPIEPVSREEAIRDGAMVFSPEDMYCYCSLPEPERLFFLDYKRHFGGFTEWKVLHHE